MMRIVKRISLLVVQALGGFIYPWPKLVRKYFSRRIQASIFGILVSLSVFVLIWVLLIGQNSLSNRTVASVLISPDFKVVKAGTAYKETRLSENCRSYGAERPRETITITKSGPVCRGWAQNGQGPYGLREWVASQYHITQFSPRITKGNSRSDALETFVDPVKPLLSKSFSAFVLFLVCQTGFFSYRRFLNREEKMDNA
jgi:hypothetical protein